MKKQEFQDLFDGLVDLYDGRIDPEKIDSWWRWLKDVPLVYVEQAILSLADNPSIDLRYPPNALQIRRIARQMSGATEFAAVEEETEADPDDLIKALFDLEYAYYHEGTLNPVQWQHLANEFEHHNRPHTAEHVRDKLRRVNSVRESDL